MEKERIWRDLFFEQDARDGRDGIGSAVVNHRIRFEMTGDGREQVFFVVYSLADDVDKWDEERIALWIEEEEKRQVSGANLFYYRCSTLSLISAVRPWFQNWVPM